MKMRTGLFLMYCLLPGICWGINLDTKIVWQNWAFNNALMNYCLPVLNENEQFDFYETPLKQSAKRFHPEESIVGKFEVMFHDKSTGILDGRDAVLVPKCTNFVNAYVAQYKQNPGISLNQIISMCMDTIADKLVCEGMVLTLVDVSSDDPHSTKKYNSTKMLNKIKDSITADRVICSPDNLFCTTYNLLNESRIDENLSLNKLSPDNADAIYEKSTGKIIGFCSGLPLTNSNYLHFYQGNARCKTTDDAYAAYEFKIYDKTDSTKVEFDYVDWQSVADYEKSEVLPKLKELWTDKVAACVANIKISPDTNRALSADHIALALHLCAEDNQDINANLVCRHKVFQKYTQHVETQLNNLKISKYDNNVYKFKSALSDVHRLIKVLAYQSYLTLEHCQDQPTN